MIFRAIRSFNYEFVFFYSLRVWHTDVMPPIFNIDVA